MAASLQTRGRPRSATDGRARLAAEAVASSRETWIYGSLTENLLRVVFVCGMSPPSWQMDAADGRGRRYVNREGGHTTMLSTKTAWGENPALSYRNMRAII